MDIQKLKYFYATAQLEHITRASEILHISQPSLTQAIQSLEFELGVSLFERQGRRIILTQFGKYLKERLDTLLPQFDNIPNEIEQLKSSVNNTVKLNILAASTFVINAIIGFHKRHPDAVFDFEQNELKRDCDITITTNGLKKELPKGVKRTVKKERIFLAVTKDSPYAKKSEIDLEEVKDEGFVMLNSARLFGVICNKFCSQAGFLPKIAFESDSPTAVQNIIGVGSGIVAFWPEYSWGKIKNKDILLLPIQNPICQRDLIIDLHARTPKSEYAEDFYNYLIKQMKG